MKDTGSKDLVPSKALVENRPDEMLKDRACYVCGGSVWVPQELQMHARIVDIERAFYWENRAPQTYTFRFFCGVCNARYEVKT